MSASNEFETDILELIFLNTALADIGDSGGLQPSAAAGSLYISLHTADPGEGGNQSTNEASYTGYGRVAVARSGAQWTVTGDTASNDNTVTFGQNTGSSQTVTHFACGKESSGATGILFSNALSASLNVDTNVTPSFAAGNLTFTAA